MSKATTTVFQTPFEHVKYALVTSEVEYLSFMLEYLGISDPSPFCSAGTFAQVSCYERPGKPLFCLVQVNKRKCKKQKPVQVVGLLVHEAVHVWQKTVGRMQESTPSAEFEAYSVQRIVQDLLSVY